MDFKQLFDDYRQGKLMAEERAAFEKLLHNPKSEEFLRQLMDESLASIEPVEAPQTQELVYAKLQEHLQGEHGKPRHRKCQTLVRILAGTSGNRKTGKCG